MRRTLQAIPLLILISMILFGITNNAPGGALAPYLQNPHITPADIARLKHNLGLDQPLPVQYFHWVGHAIRGDFGWSTSNAEPVFDAIMQRFGATVELMGASLLVALTLGLAAGIFSAVLPYSVWDYIITGFAFFGQSMPIFWFALMLQLGLAVHGIPLPGGYMIQLPSAGISSLDTFNLGDRLDHLVLPTIALSFLSLALYSRFTRSSMLEVLSADYIRTAAAKGLPFHTILLKHGLKNALIPVVTIVAISLPSLIAGAVVTETIFAWPGMGRLFINALQQGDIALLMGYLCLVSVLVVFSNLLADVAYAWLDPRVKYD
ncbi:MAG TPA: ABC transporter permease [Candidatus Dormibacteraeota bacterium]|nr:ABC transporter permease [Candidatus Dormibacteraeota bacterium]